MSNPKEDATDLSGPASENLQEAANLARQMCEILDDALSDIAIGYALTWMFTWHLSRQPKENRDEVSSTVMSVARQRLARMEGDKRGMN